MSFEKRLQVPSVHTRYLKQGTAFAIAVKDDARLQVVYGEGGGCILEIAGSAAAVWFPLRGSLQVRSSRGDRQVHVGETLITEIDSNIKAVGHNNGRWLAVIGGERTWAWMLAGNWGPDAQLLPDLHSADRDLRRRAIAVARANSPLELEGSTSALVEMVAHMQGPLHEAIARCPGRTLARRRQVFMRLQRVRNYISTFCNHDLDNKTLAHMANFSPGHFLRTFKTVYLETPHSYLIGQRLRRARQLLHSSDLAILDVALASGYENQCVFSRVFRQHFGITAKEMRHRTNMFTVEGRDFKNRQAMNIMNDIVEVSTAN